MILIVMGTRPEIVKMASVVDSCRTLGVDHRIVLAAQHYDWEMSGLFMKQLGLGKPDCRVRVGSGSNAVQTARAMVGLERIILRDRPEAVVVQGDTNMVLAASLASVKAHVPVFHVEAGVRSYDLRMPEEHNRRIVDHVSSYLFAPTLHTARVLRKENVWGKISVVGNTVIDACLKFMGMARKKSDLLRRIRYDRFALATLHRAENVDQASTLRTLVKVLTSLSLPVVFPVHPRTMQRLCSYRLVSKLKASPNVQLLPPVGYFDMLTLMGKCTFIVTDSGGIQEEATSPNIRKFVFVLRRRTDRPESVRSGFAKLMGTQDHKSIARSIDRLSNMPISVPMASPYGDGRAGARIAHVLMSECERTKRRDIL